MAFGQPSFAGLYGAGGSTGTQAGSMMGGPNMEITSPMAGGTGGDTPSVANADTARYGLLGEPLSWWFVIMLVLVGMSLLGGSRA